MRLNLRLQKLEAESPDARTIVFFRTGDDNRPDEVLLAEQGQPTPGPNDTVVRFITIYEEAPAAVI